MFSHSTCLNWKVDKTKNRTGMQQSEQVESVVERTVCRLESQDEVQKPSPALSEKRTSLLNATIT